MVRLSDLDPAEAEHMRARVAAMEPIPAGEWVSLDKPLSECTVAVVTTAGLHRRTDPPFAVGALDYRIIPGDVDFGELAMSHISTNFDRSAFQEDPNISFPLGRLREMVAEGEVGAVANWHYSFMGAMPIPQMFEETGTEVGRLLADDGVDVALLVPI